MSKLYSSSQSVSASLQLNFKNLLNLALLFWIKINDVQLLLGVIQIWNIAFCLFSVIISTWFLLIYSIFKDLLYIGILQLYVILRALLHIWYIITIHVRWKMLTYTRMFYVWLTIKIECQSVSWQMTCPWMFTFVLRSVMVLSSVWTWWVI